ncbi:MAG: HAD family hydrolase [Clostridiales bacterium]|nr:HAD family hydrolase [Clostridiales bacterium]
MKQSYQYFFMDLDGTISDPKEGITKSVAYALDYYGIKVENLDTLEKFIGPPLSDSFQEFYGFDREKSLDAVEKYREYFKDKGIFENELYPGMEQLLKTITEQGGKIVLATSKPEVFAKRILEYFHIDKYFTFAAGSTLDTTRNKKADVIRYALDSLGIAAEEAIMIGDRKHDVIGAKENGMACIGVLFGYGDREELESAGADVIVETVEELEEKMKKLLKTD